MENPSFMHHNLSWGVRRSIRYHARRQMFFERFNSTTNAVGVLFGSATILTMFHQFSQDSKSFWWVLPAVIVTFFSSLNLVIGTTRMAQVHHDLVRKFTELEKELLTQSPSESMIREIAAKRVQIEADEPPIYRILDILCHNELLKSDGYDPRSCPDYRQVGAWQRFFSHFFDLGADKIQPLSTKSPS